MHSPSYRSGNDVIVHLCWNALHKCGGKQSGDINWSIITKPHPWSTQEAWLRLQSICNVMPYLTIVVLESLLNVTPWHCPRSLINLTGASMKRLNQTRWASTNHHGNRGDHASTQCFCYEGKIGRILFFFHMKENKLFFPWNGIYSCSYILNVFVKGTFLSYFLSNPVKWLEIKGQLNLLQSFWLLSYSVLLLSLF